MARVLSISSRLGFWVQQLQAWQWSTDMSSTQKHQEIVNTQGLACDQKERGDYGPLDAVQTLGQMAFANFKYIHYTDSPREG